MFTLFSCFYLATISATNNDEKIYIDDTEVNSTFDHFQIHTGNNVWIETNSLYRDEFGLFTFHTNISSMQNSTSPNAEYVKKWKCPYCYKYWPIGTKCQNSDCPSKYN